MTARLTLSALGLCLLTGLLAAGATPRPPWFVARTAGVTEVTLRGAAEFGAVSETHGAGPYVLTLGAESPSGAIVFTWVDGSRPEPGVYRLSQGDSAGVRALIVTGPPTRPTGAFHARGGTLTVTRSSGDVMQGRFELDAVGFEAAEPMNEERGLIARGAFDARPS